ncbi:acyl-CoA desaturase [Myxococcaceae bacterium GXIMD 01537]
MAQHSVTFPAPPRHGFASDVKARVQAYFDERGLSSKANTEMKVKTAIILGTFWLSFAAILTSGLPVWALWGLCVVMGVAMAGIGFSIAHDAQHGAYSDNPRVNALLGMTFDMLGANGYMWRITHNVIHHTYTNVNGVDEDLEVSPLLRLSPHSAHMGLHRFQQVYALFAYSLATINWALWKDYDYFARHKLGPYEGRKHPRGEVVFMVASKVFFFAWSVALPFAVLPLPWWQVLVGMLTVHVVAGAILGVVFQLAHVVEDTGFPAADAQGLMPDTWMVHQMHTTANFCVGNRLLTWYVGGLNHQVEHHLFPKVCSVHYPAISAIVRETAREHGVPYYANPTFLGAVRSHLKMLGRLGRGEKAPAVAPAPAVEPSLGAGVPALVQQQEAATSVSLVA